ncbi:fluoride efflux transporter CrcB [Actinospica durhamensis]|uniref:Fluoride-specific ion channel FluC n=1 Tax=Actinospica durhamensis TaxID=1508375 RepID=A0A941EMY8_9ACTN|nr:fluoride efflux transporter CrcB [Actinospica durhamensis]MBR7833888.1 fluoride efflux transporter CrcB [Actinospica durhamensis]
MLFVLVGLGASFGAIARYLLDQAVSRRRAFAFPFGTWLINITGSFVLGLMTGLTAHHGLDTRVLAVVGTGICGGYTTFSTFSYETLRVAEDGSSGLAVGNILGSFACGLGAAALGLGLALAV